MIIFETLNMILYNSVFRAKVNI